MRKMAKYPNLLRKVQEIILPVFFAFKLFFPRFSTMCVFSVWKTFPQILKYPGPCSQEKGKWSFSQRSNLISQSKNPNQSDWSVELGLAYRIAFPRGASLSLFLWIRPSVYFPNYVPYLSVIIVQLIWIFQIKLINLNDFLLNIV
jgi:hypothetical protein